MPASTVLQKSKERTLQTAAARSTLLTYHSPARRSLEGPKLLRHKRTLPLHPGSEGTRAQALQQQIITMPMITVKKT